MRLPATQRKINSVSDTLGLKWIRLSNKGLAIRPYERVQVNVFSLM